MPLGVRRQDDIIGIIESAYQVELAEEAWLRSILDSTASALAARAGVFGVLYDINGPRVRVRCALDDRDGTYAKAASAVMTAPDGQHEIKRGLASSGCACALASETVGIEHTRMFDMFGPLGVVDMLGINGLDPSGLACFVGVLLPRRTTLRRSLRSSLARVSAHVAAGHRLMLRTRQHRPPPDASDAIFTSSGRVEHAVGEAREKATLEQLRRAVAAIEHARSAKGRREPDGAVSEWRGLVSARWSLIDEFDADGKRYIVARANEPSVKNGLAMLTERERQVVGYLALGHSMKFIAYELGIAYSTVRVLTMRACAKLGVKGVDGLIEAVAASQRGPD